MFKIGQRAAKSWRKLRGFAHLADVIRKRHQAIKLGSGRRMRDPWTPDLTIARFAALIGRCEPKNEDPSPQALTLKQHNPRSKWCGYKQSTITINKMSRFP
jgi:hypothetical protein